MSGSRREKTRKGEEKRQTRECARAQNVCRFSRFLCFSNLLQFSECDQNSIDRNRITEVKKCFSSCEASPLSPGTFSFHTLSVNYEQDSNWILDLFCFLCLFSRWIWINVKVSSASLKRQWCFLTGCFKLHNAQIFIAIDELIKILLRRFHAQLRWIWQVQYRRWAFSRGSEQKAVKSQLISRMLHSPSPFWHPHPLICSHKTSTYKPASYLHFNLLNTHRVHVSRVSKLLLFNLSGGSDLWVQHRQQ